MTTGFGLEPFGLTPFGDPIATSAVTDYRALNSANRALYLETLRSSHSYRLSVQILDHNEAPMGSATFPESLIVSGEVQCSVYASGQGGLPISTPRKERPSYEAASSGVSRSWASRQLTLALIDPDGSLAFVPDNPSDAAIFAQDHVQVLYEVWVDALNAWVSTSVFYGVLTQLTRQSTAVSIEAASKEVELQDPHLPWNSTTWDPGTKVTDVIRDIAGIYGEEHINVPDLPDLLSKHLTLAQDQEGWAQIVELATGLGRQVFYDGSGYLRLRRVPGTGQPSHVFEVGEDVITSPSIAYDPTILRNAWIVYGAQSGSSQIVAKVKADPSHPLSPESLSRNGQPAYFVGVVNDTSIKTKSDAQSLANQYLATSLAISVAPTFDALTIPHLEPGDVCGLMTSDGTYVEFPLASFTLPLTPDTPMSIGLLSQVVDVQTTLPSAARPVPVSA